MKVDYIGKISEENLPAIFVPYFLESVHAGFPSPASDYMESPIDLNKHLIKNSSATSGQSRLVVNVDSGSTIDPYISDDGILCEDGAYFAYGGTAVVGLSIQFDG